MADHAELLALLQGAVREAIERGTGGRVGYVLSGGLDSSTVVSLGDQLEESFPTFTGYYDLPGFDERRYARLVGWGDHHEIKITPEDFVEHFDDMAAAVRPPYQGMGCFGQYMVGRYIATTDVRYVLSGEGSDELFGGYPRLMAVAGVELPDNYPAGYRPPPGYPLTLEAALAYDLARLGDLLAVDDQCMNAHGLEARAPFTDRAVVDFALGLDPADRVGKRFLRAAVRGIVPDRIIDRTDNMGFPIPLAQWAQTEPVRSFVFDRLGFLPDPADPWARDWFHELIRDSIGDRVPA